MKTLLLIILIFILISSPVSAQEIKPEVQKIYTGSVFYPIKRLWEKIALNILFMEDSKINYHSKLLKARFAELAKVIEDNSIDQLQEVTERFSYQAGIYAQAVLSSSDRKLKSKVVGEFKNYQNSIIKLQEKVSPNTSFYRLVQYDIETLQILSDQLK